MPKITYDPEMRNTEHGGRLYAYWKRIKGSDISQEFKKYTDFYAWAMQNGYTLGAKLFKHDQDEPYGPDNCYWIPRSEWVNNPPAPSRDYVFEQKWDETVNRIRRYYGMEPIRSSEV